MVAFVIPMLGIERIYSKVDQRRFVVQKCLFIFEFDSEHRGANAEVMKTKVVVVGGGKLPDG